MKLKMIMMFLMMALLAGCGGMSLMDDENAGLSDAGITAEGGTDGSLGMIEIEADIDSIDDSAGAITVIGSPGLRILVEDATRISDKGVAKDASAGVVEETTEIGIEDLDIGDRVRISAFLRESEIIASEVERGRPSARVTLQGPTDSFSVDDSSITILGVTVMAKCATKFTDAAGNFFSKEEFFDLLKDGDFVQVQGLFLDEYEVIVASSVALPEEIR